MGDYKMDEEMIKKMLDYYTGKNIELHIIKKDKEWYNCFIISKEGDGIYIVMERKFGKRTLFANNVFDLDECKIDKTGAQRIGHGWEYRG